MFMLDEFTIVVWIVCTGSLVFPFKFDYGNSVGEDFNRSEFRASHIVIYRPKIHSSCRLQVSSKDTRRGMI